MDAEALARNVAATGGLLVSERLSLVLGPVLGAAHVSELVRAAAQGGDLAALLSAEPAVRTLAQERGASSPGAFVTALLDPAGYTGLAEKFVDDVVAPKHPAAGQENA